MFWRNEMFGELSALPYEEYLTIYNETGLDIDGRLSLLKDILVFSELVVIKFIEFIKIIPGFSQLPLEDKVNLTRGMYRKIHLSQIYLKSTEFR